MCVLSCRDRMLWMFLDFQMMMHFEFLFLFTSLQENVLIVLHLTSCVLEETLSWWDEPVTNSHDSGLKKTSPAACDQTTELSVNRTLIETPDWLQTCYTCPSKPLCYPSHPLVKHRSQGWVRTERNWYVRHACRLNEGEWGARECWTSPCVEVLKYCVTIWRARRLQIHRYVNDRNSLSSQSSAEAAYQKTTIKNRRGEDIHIL